MTRTWRAPAWTAAIAIAVTVTGTTTVAAGGADAISESEFLSLLTDDHPAVVALRGELAAAEGERRTARTDNPGLSFEREAPENSPAQTTLTLSWRPPLDGRRGLANEAAAAGLAAAEQKLEWKRLQLRSELRELFAHWSLAVERRDLLADVTRRVEQLAGRSRARAASGEESGLDARRLELAAATTSSALATSEAELVRAVADMQGLFPSLDVTRRPVPPALPAVTIPLDVSSRADLLALELQAERAELSRRLAGRVLEFPAVIGGWTSVDQAGAEVGGPVVGLEWRIPLFDRGQGERTRARGEAEVARALVESERARARAELDAARTAYEHLRRAAIRVLEVTTEIAPLLEAATAEFRAEEATLTDLLDAVRSVTDARLRALELHAEALAAHRQLEMITSRPLTPGDMQ